MGRSKSLLVGLVAMVAVCVVAGPPAPAPAAAAPGPQVLMVDNEPDLTRWHFDPAQITVPAGTTVVWMNKGKEDHSVKADDNSFDSGLKSSGATFSRAFARPGTYSYHCAPHPWMKGTVEVIPASRTAAADTPAASTTSTSVTVAAPPVTTAPAAPAATAAPSTPAPETTAPPADEAPSDQPDDPSADESAAPGSHHGRSGDPLAGTLAIVLLPTLGALALGAKLRQSRS